MSEIKRIPALLVVLLAMLTHGCRPRAHTDDLLMAKLQGLEAFYAESGNAPRILPDLDLQRPLAVDPNSAECLLASVKVHVSAQEMYLKEGVCAASVWLDGDVIDLVVFSEPVLTELDEVLEREGVAKGRPLFSVVRDCIPITPLSILSAATHYAVSTNARSLKCKAVVFDLLRCGLHQAVREFHGAGGIKGFQIFDEYESGMSCWAVFSPEGRLILALYATTAQNARIESILATATEVGPETRKRLLVRYKSDVRGAGKIAATDIYRMIAATSLLLSASLDSEVLTQTDYEALLRRLPEEASGARRDK